MVAAAVGSRHLPCSVRVTILGGGIAGAATALALARLRKGTHPSPEATAPTSPPPSSLKISSVRVLDRITAEQLAGRAGAGFALQPTALLALDRLGVLETVADPGRCGQARMTRLMGRTKPEGGAETGRTVLDLRYSDAIESSFALGAERAELQRVLLAAAEAAGADVQLGVDVRAVRSDGEVVVASGDGNDNDSDNMDFSSEAALLSSHSEDEQHLVINATGSLHAVPLPDPCLRRMRRRTKTYPFGALWALLPDGEYSHAPRDYTEHADSSDGLLWNEYDQGARYMAGLMPTGSPLEPRGSTFFFSVPVREMPKYNAMSREEWQDHVVRHAPSFRAVVEKLPPPAKLPLARYADTRMWRWDAPLCGRQDEKGDGLHAIMIGDAGHACSPQLGQGACLALFDALAVADSFHAAASVRDVGRAYTQSRYWHLWYYQTASSMLTPFWQSHSRTFGELRDRFFWPFNNHIPWVKRQSTLSLLGVKDGWFSSLDLDPYRDLFSRSDTWCPPRAY